MKKKVLAVCLMLLMFSTPTYASIEYNPKPNIIGVNFNDIPANHWAKSTIIKLAAQKSKILGGYPDGTFRPDQNMSRAEFMTALVRTMGYTVSQEVYSTYTDVPVGHWASKYIGIAQQKGIAEPDDYGERLKPEEIISRFEACRMLINCFSKTKAVVNDNTVTMYPVFKDAQKLDQKHKKAVYILYKKGILKGYEDNTAGLNRYATRAELAAFIMRFIENADKLENYSVSPEDIQERKPFYNTNGEYVTYIDMLPDTTKTVKGWTIRNPELTEQINWLEWEHIDKNYNGKYKNFIMQAAKRMKIFKNPFSINFNNTNIIVINVTVSYTGEIPSNGSWNYDYAKLLRNVLFHDNSISYNSLKYTCSLEEMNAWYYGKATNLGCFTNKVKTQTYTLIVFSNNLPTTGEVKLYGGRDTVNATDYRCMVINY
ncbi:MAG: S-layer homology domain-containing protein [Ignavibacteriales bacterium]